MRTIHKYPLHPADLQPLSVPGSDAKFLHVGEQHGGLQLWAEVDPSKPSIAYMAAIVGTGHTVPEGFEFVGTVIAHGGTFVWHVYVRRA